MCNDYGLTHPITRINQRFRVVQMPLIFPGDALPNLEPREDIRPTDPAPVVRARSDGAAEWVTMRWGFPPSAPKRPPVINFRADGRTFTSGRCLIPASHFFEFTGEKAPKSKWKFTMPDGEPFCIAGLWRDSGPDASERFTMLTIPPGPDVGVFHDRQIVPLGPKHWGDWLNPDVPSAEVLTHGPHGTLVVEQVR